MSVDLSGYHIFEDNGGWQAFVLFSFAQKCVLFVRKFLRGGGGGSEETKTKTKA